MANYATIDIELRGNAEDIEKFWEDVEKNENYNTYNRKYLTYRMGLSQIGLQILQKLIVEYKLFFTFGHSTDMDYNQQVTFLGYDETHEMYAWVEQYEFGEDVVSIDENGQKHVHTPFKLVSKTEKENVTKDFMMDMKKENRVDIYNYMFKQARIKKMNSLF